GVLEEGQVGPGRALLVAVEQVIDRGIVLVDALLHQPQPEHADVELDIARRIAGDRCDVVDALELHRCARGRPPPLTPRIAASTSRRRSTSPRMPATTSLNRNASARRTIA